MLVIKFLIIILPLFILLYNKTCRAQALYAYSRGALAAVSALLFIGLFETTFSALYSSIPPLAWNTINITVEEGAKLVFFTLFLRGKAIDRHLIRYAVALALGFAGTETLLYISASLPVILLRVVVASLLHILTLLIVVLGGYYHQYRRLGEQQASPSYYVITPLRSVMVIPLQIIIHLGYNILVKNII